MFFILSKVLWLVAEPTNFIVTLGVIGLGLTAAGAARWGRRFLVLCALALFVGGALPLGPVLLRPLEDRFPQQPADLPAPTGIILLGGSVDPAVSVARGTPAMDAAGARLTSAVALALRYPDARFVFTGGSAALVAGGPGEAGVAKEIFTSLGIPAARIELEDRSRNTYENAVFTKDLVKPKPGERWLLVTSAFHMPRSVGIFREVGFPVIPYPVDYTTLGQPRDFWEPNRQVSEGLSRLDLGLHEWIGLAAYWLTGRSDALFPGP